VSFLSSLFDAGASASGAQVAIASNLSPRVVVPLYGQDGGAPQRAPTPADFLLRLVRPSIRVETTLGAFAFEPFGPPDPTAGMAALGLMATIGTALAGFAVYGIVCAAKGRAV
jgi:hypothetical protein